MTEASTRTQRRAEATRRSIVAAAQEIVATDGGDGLTLEAVAARADVAVQTIYNRIGGRSALLTAVATQAMDENRVYMDAAYTMTGTAQERLLRAAAAYVSFARERQHEFRILVEPPDLPDAVVQIAELTAHQNGRLAAAIRAGIDEGFARSDLDPDDLATTFWATMNGLLALAWRPGALRVADADIDRLVAAYVATVTDGLRRR